jgi:apolipoprotein N-acyltransferase
LSKRTSLIGAAAVAAGALFPFGLAPISWSPLTAVSLGACYWLCAGANPRRAAWLGWLFGCGVMGVGVSWVQVAVHQFGLPVLVFSVSITILFVALLAIFPALAAWLTARIDRRLGVRSALTFSALWTLVEWLRGWLFTGFPWLYAGYSQMDTPLSGFAPLGGVLLVSFVVALSGALLVVCVTGKAWPVRLGAAAAIASFIAVGAALQGLHFTKPVGAPLEVALIQGNIDQDLKFSLAHRKRTLALYRSLTEPYAGVDLVIWPETAIPAFADEVGDYLRGLEDWSAAARTALLTGIPTATEDRREYNSVMLIGETPGQYDKRHLVPFGEYLPLRAWLGALLDFLVIPLANFSSGADEQPPLRVGGFDLGVSICYEDTFTYEIRKAFPEAELLVNVSNDAWYGDSLAPHQHLEMARMRALEFSRSMLRATNTGVSAIIDERGRVVATIPQFEAGSVSAAVLPLTGMTPFARLGDMPLIILLLLWTAAAAIILRVTARGVD